MIRSAAAIVMSRLRCSRHAAALALGPAAIRRHLTSHARGSRPGNAACRRIRALPRTKGNGDVGRMIRVLPAAFASIVHIALVAVAILSIRNLPLADG
jgi:hypothetical protein